MSLTSFSGPVGTYTHQLDGTSSGYSDMGLSLLSQNTTLTQNSTTAVTNVLYLPANSQIVDIIVDTTTAWDSGTSAVLSVGTAAAGTQYAGSVDVKGGAARIRPTFTAAQLGTMLDVGSNVGVYITVTPTGATSAGTTTVTLLYVQTP